MRRLGLPLLAVVVGFAAGTVGQTLGAFSGATDNPGNYFEAAASFVCSSPGSQILTPEADTWVDEGSATSNFGTASNLEVRSRVSNDSRTLVRFALPAVPAGCELKVATLRLFANTSFAGRTIKAYRAASSWNENTVTWNTDQPATTGGGATTTSSAGWNEWSATSLVEAMYSGTNNGFLLQDYRENDSASSGGAKLQDYSSREGAKPPQLVITFGDPSGVTCTDPAPIPANADTYVDQASPDSNYGGDANVHVRSAVSTNRRTLVSFPLPAVPVGCSVNAATLRLYATAAATATIQAFQVAVAWVETGATWNVQPATTGAAATTTTGLGWREWEVKTQVNAMYSGTNFGFLLRDQTEDAAFARLWTFDSRESGSVNKPELVLDFGPPPPTVPDAPSGLSATAVSWKRIDLSWTDNSTNEDGFKVERSPGGAGNWEQVAVRPPSATSFSDTGLSASTAYDYRVRAFNQGGNSSYSNVASATTQPLPAPPDAPSGLSATAVSNVRIDLAWTDNATNEDGFRIERSPGGLGSWAEIDTVGPNVTSYQNTGLSSGTAYDYRVRAYNDGGNSSFSNVASATTRAFPQVQSITSTSFAAWTIPHNVAMPATVNVGDLLLCVIVNRGSTAVTTPEGWSLIAFYVAETTLSPRLSIFAKDADGTEDGTTVDFATETEAEAAAQVYRITNWGGTVPGDVAATYGAEGISANPDPGSLTPSWGALDTLWIAAYAQDEDDDALLYPTSYTDGTYTQSHEHATDSVSLGTARRELNAATEDPGTFTIAASEQWVAFTLAIKPPA